MKKSELRKIIREEITSIISERNPASGNQNAATIASLVKKAGIKVTGSKYTSRYSGLDAFFIDVKDKSGKKEVLIFELDDNNNLIYNYGPNQDLNLGKLSDTSKILKVLKKIGNAEHFGQTGLKWNESVIKEDKNTEADQFAEEIIKVMKKYFPNSYCDAHYSTNLGEGIYVKFLLGSKKEWFNGIPENAPAKIVGWIENIRGGNLSDTLIWEPDAGSVLIKPVKNPHLAYERVKFPIRKTKGDSKKILKTIDTLFSRTKKILKDTVPQMTDEHQKWVRKYI